MLHSLCSRNISTKLTKILENSSKKIEDSLQIYHPNWEAPKFSINTPNQAEEWTSFYTMALDFLQVLDIDPDVEDQGKKGWHQIKMMPQGDECQALQTLIDNQNISPGAQWTPALASKVIQSVIKEDVHFWHYCDQLLSDLYQLPDEGIHSLFNRISILVGKCRFPSGEIKEVMKIMALQHDVKYDEARDWICLHDQATLTYQSLLTHCKQLGARCEQFQQAQAQGKAHLISITAASGSHSSLHANTQSTTTHQICQRCGYSHPCVSCPAFGHRCYNCCGTGHFTALCRRPHTNRCPADNPSKQRESRGRSSRSSSHRCSSRSTSRARQSHRNDPCNSRRSINSSPSPSQDHIQRRSPQCGRCSSTPYRHQFSHFKSSHPNSQATEGQLLTDRSPDGHRSFHTMLQLVTKQGCKFLPVKVDLGANVNTIPLSHYKSLFPKHFTQDGTLKKHSSEAPDVLGPLMMVKHNIF